MALEHNDRKLPFEWAIEELKIVYSKEPNKFYTFRLDRWVDKNHKLNGAISPMAITPIDPSTESAPGKYKKRKVKLAVDSNLFKKKRKMHLSHHSDHRQCSNGRN